MCIKQTLFPAADQAQGITPAAIIAAYSLTPDKAEALRCLLAPNEELQNLWRARAALSEAIKSAERALLSSKIRGCGNCGKCSLKTDVQVN